MKKIIMSWMLLRIHRSGLCKPFHAKKAQDSYPFHHKGWCPMLQLSIDLIKMVNL